MDYNSLGRLTCLSPVTWVDGWPYFGLPGNLGRTPRTWVKPKSRLPQRPRPLFERSDDFDGPALKPIWQWNHVPLADKWSLAERPGCLRLRVQPANSFWEARNSLTQRAVGPISIATTKLDGSGLAQGDVAGLALLGLPYRWIGLRRDGESWQVEMFDQQTGRTTTATVEESTVWLRAECDFLNETAQLSWSSDGTRFEQLGEPVVMVFQLKTFQGIRYALFAYNAEHEGGHADFDSMHIDEPHPKGLMRPVPLGATITIVGKGIEQGIALGDDAVRAGTPTPLQVTDMGLGRVALCRGSDYVSVDADGAVHLAHGQPSTAESFQWMETPTGDLILMSLATNRFLRLTDTGEFRADSPGPQSDGKDGVRFDWIEQPQ
jgi:xylan 1,4-beta-xylosidase